MASPINNNSNTTPEKHGKHEASELPTKPNEAEQKNISLKDKLTTPNTITQFSLNDETVSCEQKEKLSEQTLDSSMKLKLDKLQEITKSLLEMQNEFNERMIQYKKSLLEMQNKLKEIQQEINNVSCKCKKECDQQNEESQYKITDQENKLPEPTLDSKSDEFQQNEELFSQMLKFNDSITKKSLEIKNKWEDIKNASCQCKEGCVSDYCRCRNKELTCNINCKCGDKCKNKDQQNEESQCKLDELQKEKKYLVEMQNKFNKTMIQYKNSLLMPNQLQKETNDVSCKCTTDCMLTKCGCKNKELVCNINCKCGDKCTNKD